MESSYLFPERMLEAFLCLLVMRFLIQDINFGVGCPSQGMGLPLSGCYSSSASYFSTTRFLHPLLVFGFLYLHSAPSPSIYYFLPPTLSSFHVSAYVFPSIHYAIGAGPLGPLLPYSCPLTCLQHPLVTHS
jgi:hypothetical protein